MFAAKLEVDSLLAKWPAGPWAGQPSVFKKMTEKKNETAIGS